MRLAIAPAVLVAGLVAALAALDPVAAAAQSDGGISGRVRERGSERGLGGAQVLLDGRVAAVADTLGRYRVRSVRAGWHRVSARLIGYRSLVLDSVRVEAGGIMTLDFELEQNPLELDPVIVTAPYDAVLDPLATASEQKFSAAELRELPVSTLEEAIALSAGSVGTSYRGGRLGQESFILDGLGIKNQLDASSGGLGLVIPPDLLSEASLVTNGFSARYGQALSGLVNVVTRDPGEEWEGRAAYEGDRPFGGSLDRGLDRVIVSAGGPLAGKLGLVTTIDANGRLDADPVNAPAPVDPLDPRSSDPYPLPHNSGEQWTGAAKLVFPVADRATFRVLGLHSEDQRLLYDPAFKYNTEFAPAQRLRGDLVSGHVQYVSDPRSTPITLDLRVARYVREFVRGELDEEVDYAVGAFTGSRFNFVGEDRARVQDPSPDAIPGLRAPLPTTASPWGVPAFFLTDGSRGNLAWNRFGETRFQLDAVYGGFRRLDLYVGGEYTAQQVRTYQRTFGWLPLGAEAKGDTIPSQAISAFSPRALAAYAEGQLRVDDLAFTAGLRYDQFDSRSEDVTESRGAQKSLSPRVAVSTVLSGATVVVSYGRFSQAPDYQFLVDAAFDDTTRTGRFRRGNPNLGFEKAHQYEMSVRLRPREGLSVRVGAYLKRLTGLVASIPLGVNPDSTIFGNADAGTVKGGEVVLERDVRDGIGVRLAYTFQDAVATATDPFLLNRAITVDPITGDTTRPARAEFPLDFDRRHTLTLIARGRVADAGGPLVAGIRPLAALEGAVILRFASGLPFSITDSTGDSIIGLPNSSRLPSTSSVDLLVRRSLKLGGASGAVYLDVRNLLGRRNVVAVRRDTGVPQPTEEAILLAAEQAYLEHPEPIPFESARYRAQADLNGDGYLSGRDELFPLYVSAARDYTQPVFAYGPPRLARLGFEVLF
ncbi:MAG TPA: TonB-dependent receptor [Gemmatimonadales bacterium]|nr:TonB-dependent receptor [Gemmatimonadales bacterium]